MRRGGVAGGVGGRSSGNYTNPCLTMHQPWASLLVYGIKRIEGRSWPTPIRGRLWIHAASKVPEEATIKAMEDFYREIYAVNGITDIKFPDHYPVSRLLGCVDVVGCVPCEELASWEAVPEGVRLEGQTEFCWLCEHPQKLLVPFEMRGYQRVYNLEKKIYEAAVRGLVPVKGPSPVKFPLPNPRDPFSLKPGSIPATSTKNKASVMEQSASLTSAIAGARAAATQFNKKDQNFLTNSNQSSYSEFTTGGQPVNKAGQFNHMQHEDSPSSNQTREDFKQLPGASAKVFFLDLSPGFLSNFVLLFPTLAKQVFFFCSHSNLISRKIFWKFSGHIPTSNIFDQNTEPF